MYNTYNNIYVYRYTCVCVCVYIHPLLVLFFWRILPNTNMNNFMSTNLII